MSTLIYLLNNNKVTSCFIVCNISLENSWHGCWFYKKFLIFSVCVSQREEKLRGRDQNYTSPTWKYCRCCYTQINDQPPEWTSSSSSSYSSSSSSLQCWPPVVCLQSEGQAAARSHWVTVRQMQMINLVSQLNGILLGLERFWRDDPAGQTVTAVQDNPVSWLWSQPGRFDRFDCYCKIY